MGLERRGCVVQPVANWANWQREEPVDEAKPFDIPKREVWEAFKQVKANQGAAGVDGQSIAEFEADLSNNLYKLWNRLSSGSYFPPPVRRVDIPKANGGTRPLGIPTVADRIAQEVARRYLEPILEPVFHADSYGYRPGKSAIDAVRTSSSALLALRLGARSRRQGLLRQHRLGADAQGGPSSYGLPVGAALHRALAEGVRCRWRTAASCRDMAGTPQGGVISPLLANLFLHYAFDMWMARKFPHIPFERYADDAICHCKSAEEAQGVMERACRPLCGLQAGAASGEDEDRLLQGCEPARRLPEHPVRLSRASSSEPGRRCGEGGSASSRTASCPPPARRR